MYYVYAIYTKSGDKLYVGQTNNINRRLLEHNNPEQNKRHFTAKFKGPWELIYKEEHASRSVAMAREKKLKSHQGRNFLKAQLNIPG